MAKQKSYRDYIKDDEIKKPIKQDFGQGRVHTSNREKTPSYKTLYQELGFSNGKVTKDDKWDNELLQPLSQKKYGKSFDAKLNTIFGGDKWAARDFERFMNYREANQTIDNHKANEATSKWENAHKKSTGSDITSISDGKSDMPTAEDIQRLAQFQKDSNKSFDKIHDANRKEASKKYAKADELLAQIQKDNGVNKNAFLKGVDKANNLLGDVYDNTLGHLERFVTSATDGMLLGQVKKNLDKSPVGAPEFVKKAAETPTNKVDKAMDITGELAGAFAPIGLAYKPAAPIANALTKGLSNGGKLDDALRLLGASRGIADPAKLINAGVRGGTAMGIYSGAQQGLDEAINPEDANLKQRLTSVGLNTALGAIGDPALSGLGEGIKMGVRNLAKVDGELPTFTGKASDNVIDSLVPKQPASVKNSDDLYNFLATGEIPASKEPVQPMKINNWQDKAYPTPKENPQVDNDIVQQALKQKELTNNPDERKALDDLIENITGTRPRDLKAEEDAFVAEQMKPHYEVQQKVADAQAQWETTVKNAKEQITQIKGNFGKIYVPKHSLEDYPIPKQFLASSKDKVSDDIFSITDRMGFNSPDELVQFLKVLDLDSKTKLKDILPKDLSGDTRDLTYLEQSLRKQFREQNLSEPNKLDEVLSQIEGKSKPQPTQGGETQQAIDNTPQTDEELAQFFKDENVNNSQEPNPVADNQVAPETSSTAKPLGIVAGQADQSSYSWMGSKPTVLEKIKSGDITAKTVGQMLKTNFSSTAQVIKDTVRDISKLDDNGLLDRILGNEKNVSYKDNLYKQLRGVSRAIGQAINASKKDYGKIISTLRKNKISTDDFNAYVANVHFYDIMLNNRVKVVRQGEVAQRLQDIEHEIQNTNVAKDILKLKKEEAALLKEKTELEPYEVPAGVTIESIKRDLNRWKDTPVMAQMQQEFMAAQRRDLQMLVDAGNYSAEEVNAMIQSHPNYVYMGRVKEERQMMNPGNASKINDFIKKRTTGSEEKIYPPLESAIRNRLMSYSNASRNRAMQTIEKYAGVQGQDYFKKVDIPTSELSDSQKRNLVKYFENGKEVYYEVPPSLKDAFDSLDVKHGDDLISNALRAVGNITRKGATHLNLDFIFSSPFRETGALITSRTNLHPGELALGYLDSFMGKNLEKWSGGLFKSYKDIYKELGGHQTGFVTTDPQSTKAFIKAMDKGTLGKGIDVINPFHDRNWIGQIGQNVEHGPKLAEFRSAKNKGLDDSNAMHEAVDVIDYNEGGKAIKALNHIPFLGASVRGTTRYLQAAKENPAGFLGKNALYVTLPTLGIYAMRFAPTTSDGQRQKLRNLSDFQKNAFWYIPVPNSKDDRILAFPKLYVGAQLFANPIERVLDHITKEDPTTFKRFVRETGNDFGRLMPPTTIAGLSQLTAANANYDPMMDMAIEDATMKKNPNKLEHFNSFTSEAAKGLSKLTDKATFGAVTPSPAKLDYVMKSLTGGAGRDLLDITDNVLAKTGVVDRPQKVDTILDTLNPVRRYEYKDTAGSGLIDRLLYNDKNAYKDNEYARAQYRKETGKKTAPKTPINDFYDTNKEISSAIKVIREDKKMSSAEKKKAISELRGYQRQIGDEALKMGILQDY